MRKTRKRGARPAGASGIAVRARKAHGSVAGAGPAARRALARSVLCRAIQLGLRLPDPASARGLFYRESRDAIRRAAAVLEEGTGGPLISAAGAVASVEAIPLPEMKQAHERIFGHTLRSRVCPYETEYGREHLFQQAQELADIAGFYRAFGLEPAAGSGERPDHAACEMEFLGFLSLKEAHALESGDGEMLEVTRAALRRFLSAHVGRFGRAFGLSLAREDPDGLHGRIGRLLASFLESVSADLEIPAGPEYLALRPEEPDGVPMACGSGEQLLGIAGPRPG